MIDTNINFFVEDIDFLIENQTKYANKLMQVVEKERFKISSLSFVFCSDLYLLDINTKYLAHDYFTDIITFDNSDDVGLLNGDVFISVDRARENAFEFNVSFENEILRLLIHGVLHLIGFKDGTAEEKLTMRQKEDYYLSLQQS